MKPSSMVRAMLTASYRQQIRSLSEQLTELFLENCQLRDYRHWAERMLRGVAGREPRRVTAAIRRHDYERASWLWLHHVQRWVTWQQRQLQLRWTTHSIFQRPEALS